jgi:hypothetical protein
MDLREQRRIERDEARTRALAAEQQKAEKRSAKKQTKAEEPELSVTVLEGIERVTFHLTPEDYGFYCRSMVVLDIPPMHVSEWYSPRIAFFQSSATSNGSHYRHLRNTFFPTLGRANNAEKAPNLPTIAEESDDFFVKTGLFKTTLSVRNFTMGMEQNIPAWIDTLLTDYCNTYYPGLLDMTREIPRDADTEWYNRAASFLEATQEIYRLFDLCIDYFTSPWQIAMSIGLSRFFRNGVWFEDQDKEGGELLRKFNKFADFIDTKYAYTIEGYKGSIEDADPDHTADKKMCRDFLSDNRAQCDFSKIERLPTVIISGSKFYVFTGRAITWLEGALRFRKGGTRRKRKRSFKTRHQKRR